MLSPKYRCIFVHIPKTAGNSVNRLFGIPWQAHKDLARYAVETEPDSFARYFKFAIVRNPWDRLLSDYNFQKKKNRERKTKLHIFTETGAVRPFKAWVEKVLADPFHYPPAAWGAEVSAGVHRWSPQMDWITLDGRIAVDLVMKLEDLEEDFPRVGSKLGLPVVRLPRRNRKFHWHYSHYYDDATRDRVTNYYSEDIRRFAYTFENPAPNLFLSLLRTCVRC